MNKIYTLLSIILLLTVSCKEKKELESEENSTFVKSRAASDALRKVNEVVEHLNVNVNFLESRSKDLKRLENITYREEVDSLEGIPIKEEFIFKEAEKYSVHYLEYLQDEPLFTEEEKSSFKDDLALFDNNFTKFINATSQYIDYLKNEEYENDNWDKGQTYYRTIKDSRERCYRIKDALFQTINQIAERLEPISLDNSPSKELYMTSKADLRLLQKLVQEINDYNNTRGNIEQIEKTYNELEVNIENHRNMYANELSYIRETEDYKSFYTTLSDGLNEMKKVLRTAREGRGLSEDDLEQLNDLRYRAAEGYNKIVE